jgi:Na+-translocating ferredoxin:NAD+ oxidoreductase RnfG subunit
MNLDIRWLLPAAIYAVAPQCIAAKYMSIEQAREQMFPFADGYLTQELQLTPGQVQEIDTRSGVPGRGAQPRVWQAVVKGKLIGWLFLDQVIGKHELITYALGVNTDGSIRQLQIIEYLETYGSQVRYPNWRDQFVGKTVRDPVRVDSDIDNISGATLSARHLTDGIRRLLLLHQLLLR